MPMDARKSPSRQTVEAIAAEKLADTKDGVVRSRSSSVDAVATRSGSIEEITDPIEFINWKGSACVRMRIG